jgi:phage terminase small subunit
MKSWWRSIHDVFDLDRHHRLTLQAACEAWDRMAQAREALAEHGTTYEDRFGAPRLRPEVAIERDARLAFLRALKELDLDAPMIPAPRPMGRPGRSS